MNKSKRGRGRPKGAKNKPKPMPPLSAEGVRQEAAATLTALLAVEKDPKEARRLSAQILKLTAKPRPTGSQPGSQKFERDAAADAVAARRRDARTKELAEYRQKRNTSLPIPIECAKSTENAGPTAPSSGPQAGDTSEPTPVSDAPEASADALRQAAMDNPSVRDEFQGMQSARHAAPVPALQPVPAVQPTPASVTPVALTACAALTAEERILQAQKAQRRGMAKPTAPSIRAFKIVRVGLVRIDRCGHRCR